MSSPDIDFKEIRLHRGTRSDAFEELCCQLAGDEARTRSARFIRKGRGADGGVEAFAVLPDGREIGWQVKYHWKPDDALSSLSGSLAKALAKHSNMDRFIACVPFDAPDGRREDTKTAFSKMEIWKVAEIAKAAAAGRTIEIEFWPAADLKDRLVADPKAAGRIAFWFDKTLLSSDWFAAKLARAIKGLGARYTPATNVKLPIRHALAGVTRAQGFKEELSHLSAGIATALSLLPRSRAKEAAESRRACRAVLERMEDIVSLDEDDVPQAGLESALAAAEATVNRWRRQEANANRRSPALTTINRLHARVAEAHARLTSPRWRLINARRLLVTGEGGSGKSHLLADVCQHQIDQEAPALLVLSHLLRNGEPWSQIVDELDLPKHIRVDEFLSALNAAGEAGGVRALVVVDGINERGGQAIWSDRLAAFLHDVEPYPWISVVLSCRDTYVALTVPTNLDDRYLPRLQHPGFSPADSARYLDLRGVTTLDAPWPLSEFDIPLFLKTLCDGLALSGQTTLPRGSHGVSRIFTLYATAIAGAIERELGLHPRHGHVRKAVSALAAEIVRSGDPSIAYDRADELVAAVLPHNGRTDSDLLFQLMAAGMLSVDLEDDQTETVRFTFERFGDFTLAGGLLEGLTDVAAIKAALEEPGHRLTHALGASNLPIGGIVEALAVLVPERFGVEILDLPLPRKALWDAHQAFEDSLMTREASAISDRTWALVRESNVAGAEWDARIRLASEPHAKQNADQLHQLLFRMAMPQRDAVWSVHLAQTSRAAGQLIDWALSPRVGTLSAARAELIATTLSWFLTTSHRGVRDRATKALVAILADHAPAVRGLLDRFLGVDDAYVIERLLCAIYGAALQGRWAAHDASEIVCHIDQRVFHQGQPPLNCLAREHAALLIQWAIAHSFLLPDYDDRPSKGPFQSAWPIDHVPDSVIESFTETFPTGYVGRDAIVRSSVADGDFARYVIDRAINDWSPAPKGTAPLPTREDLHAGWLRDFDAMADAQARQTYEGLTEALERDRQTSPWHDSADTISAKAAFAAAVGEEMFERWREEAENWRRHGMYQRPASRDHADFNLAWARRWVCLRAHQLGWSQSLHGTFDDSVHNDRMTHHVERIGKKYQWIALYELCARMADNLEPSNSDREFQPDELRAIDPSLLAGARLLSEDEDDEDDLDVTAPLEPRPWDRPVPLGPVSVDDALIWRDDAEDLPDELDRIEFEDEGRTWLALKGFNSWRGGPDHLHRQLTRWLTCVVVRRKDLKAFLRMVEGRTQIDHDHFIDGEERVVWGSYLGEHPWLWADDEGADDWSRPWSPDFGGSSAGVSVRATTLGYLAEDRGYDQSLQTSVDTRLPLPWLIRGLNLRLGNGREIAFVDDQGQRLYRDPTAEQGSSTAALVDRDAFLALLARDDLAAVWLVAGEKNVYGDSPGDGFGGRRHYARVAHSVGGDLVLGARASHLEGPTDRQLQALRDAATEDE